jgi:NitT/TauT family transport system ATP-binding protein
MSAITLTDVTHSYGPRVVVDRLSLQVETGEIVALVGQTGAGKSTVLNMIMGNFAPDAGSIDVAGHDPHRETAALRGKIGVSFQTDRLLPWRTACQNVEIGLQILGYDVAERRKRAMTWLDRVKLGDACAKYPHELSGGMRQRVSLARALATDPEIVLLDESFSQLDHVTSKTLRADFGEVMRTAGKTCVLITHRIDDAIEMADRIIVLGCPAAVIFEARPATADAAALHAQIEAAMHDVVPA